LGRVPVSVVLGFTSGFASLTLERRAWIEIRAIISGSGSGYTIETVHGSIRVCVNFEEDGKMDRKFTVAVAY